MPTPPTHDPLTHPLLACVYSSVSLHYSTVTQTLSSPGLPQSFFRPKAGAAAAPGKASAATPGAPGAGGGAATPLASSSTRPASSLTGGAQGAPGAAAGCAGAGTSAGGGGGATTVKKKERGFAELFRPPSAM